MLSILHPPLPWLGVIRLEPCSVSAFPVFHFHSPVLAGLWTPSQMVPSGLTPPAESLSPPTTLMHADASSRHKKKIRDEDKLAYVDPLQCLMLHLFPLTFLSSAPRSSHEQNGVASFSRAGHRNASVVFILPWVSQLSQQPDRDHITWYLHV